MNHFFSSLFIAAMLPTAFAAPQIDLSNAEIVTPFAHSVYNGKPEQQAAALFKNRVNQRNLVYLHHINQTKTQDAPSIIITTFDQVSKIDLPMPMPSFDANADAWQKPDGYRIAARMMRGGQSVLWVVGYDARGMLFGAGRLLRELNYGERSISVPFDLNIATSPDYPLRGHQIGYRAKANSYDAWTPQDYEEYIQDLIIFGTNAIEQIPLQDPDPSPHFPASRMQMNIALSEICEKYGLEYWMWMPVMDHYDESEGRAALSEDDERGAILKSWTALFNACPKVDAVFVPTGDPGINKTEFLTPFLEKAAKALQSSHRNAKIWVSQQGLTKPDIDEMFSYINETQPTWLGGIVYGPWTKATLDQTRSRLSETYPVRLYPDITHTMMSGYPIYGFDRALALTAGREPINPRPREQALLHNAFAPDTCGFIAYSDGHHDDVNKMVWSAMGWDTATDPREAMIQYANVFMRTRSAAEFVDSDQAAAIADAILALESNWQGPLAANGSVDGTLALWQTFEKQWPALAKNNWRFQQGLFRAYFDAYTRHRLIYETRLQHEAEAMLLDPGYGWDSRETLFRAERIFRRADLEPIKPEWRKRIVELADLMFENFGHQTSVDRHAQIDYDRGTMLDTLDHPLNDRWHYEDRFHEIRQLETDEDRVEALRHLVLDQRHAAGTRYDDGTLYDNIGNIAQQPNVAKRFAWSEESMLKWTLNEKGLSWEPYMDRRRHAELDGIGNFDFYSPAWEFHMRYASLDRAAKYTYRVDMMTAPSAKYRVFGNGVDLSTFETRTALGLEFALPKSLTESGVLEIEWNIEEGEGIFITETYLIPSGK